MAEAASTEAVERARETFKQKESDKPPNASRVNNTLGRMDVGQYLLHYGVSFKQKKDRNRTMYILTDGCLFSPDHTKGEASIIQDVSGLITYQCFHDSCNHTWREARERISENDSLAQFCEGYDPNRQKYPDRGQKTATGQPAKLPMEKLENASIKQVAFRLHDRITLNTQRERIGADTGFRFLQNAIYGFVKTFFYIIGAYTSVGKTALMVQLVINAILKNLKIRIAIFSTEMSAEHILLRLMANRTTIPSLIIFRGQFDEATEKLKDEAFEYFHTKKLWLYDDVYTFEGIQERCEAIGHLDVVFIDFLQNIQGAGSLYERMAVLPVQLQKLAKDLSTCVVAMSQVSNEAVKSPSQVIGFKGAGEIAAAADVGLWLERDKENKELVHCFIRKNRHGPTGKTTLQYRDRFTRIVEKT